MAYNTGNPIGSKDPRDLADNAENFDKAVNAEGQDSWTDRLGRPRKTWDAIEREAAELTQVATEQADRAEQEADRAEAAAEQAITSSLVSGVYPADAAVYVPRGVVGASIVSPGSGGTDGEFDLAFSGGDFLINPTGRFTVESGAVTDVRITGPGLLLAANGDPPTPSFGASSGLEGADISLDVDYLVQSGSGYWVANEDGLNVIWYRNSEGTPEALLDKDGAPIQVPLSRHVGHAIQLAQAFSENAISAYKSYSGLLLCSKDADGVTRVVQTLFTGEDAKYYGLAPQHLTPADLSMEAIRSLPLKSYPTALELISDADGASRVIRAIQPDDDGPIIFGASSSSLENIGGGAELYAGTPSGVPRLRTLVGKGGITATVNGDEVELEYTGSDAETPHAFMLFVLIGQSNNTTEGGDASQATPIPPGVAFQFLAGPDRLVDLSDPDAGGDIASIMPALAREFWLRTGMGSIFVNTAVGASALVAEASPPGQPNRNWSPTGSLRGAALTKIQSAISFLNSEGYVWQGGIRVYSLGEQDGLMIDNEVITIEQHKEAFPILKAYFDENLGDKLPLLIVRTAYRSSDTTGYQQIREAQMEFAATIPGVYMACTQTITFFARGLMADSVHYNQQGKNIVGKDVGIVAAAVGLGLH